MSSRHGSVASVYSVCLIDGLGVGIVMPIVPFLFRSATWNGYLVSSFAGAQAFGALAWGRLGDRIGRKPVLVLGLLGTALSYCGFGLGVQLLQAGPTRNVTLLVSRTCGGLFGGTVTVAAAYMADLSAPHERGKRQSMVSGMFGLGLVLGPPVGASLARCPLRACGDSAAFYFAAAFACANLVMCLLFMAESRRATATAGGRCDGAEALEPDGSARSSSADGTPPGAAVLGRSERRNFEFALWLCAAVQFANRFCFTVLETSAAYLVRDYLGWGSDRYAMLFMIMGLTMAITQMGVTKRVLAAVGEVCTMQIGFCLRVFAFAALGTNLALRLPYVLVPLAAMVAMAGALSNPAVSVVVTRVSCGLAGGRAELASYGRHLGMKDAAGSLAQVIAPLVTGILYDRLHRAVLPLAGLLPVISVLLACALGALLRAPELRAGLTESEAAA